VTENTLRIHYKDQTRDAI